jgi:hypothetical protein
MMRLDVQVLSAPEMGGDALKLYAPANRLLQKLGSP